MTADPTPAPQEPINSRPECPVGEADCPVIDELVGLRRSLADLSEQVHTDPLTGLANYRYFSRALEQELERTQRSGQPTTLVMLDIDFFKRVNDQWGHEVGNQALIHLAGLLLKTVRKLDIPCRYGGEEFAIILPNTDLSASLPVAERVRQTIDESPLRIGKERLRLTVSLGVDSYRLGEELTTEQLVQRADHFLYQAKQAGRNQLCHAELPAVELVSREEKEALLDLFGSGAEEADKGRNEDSQ